VEEETVNKVLIELADEAKKNTDFILSENQKDLDRMNPEDPKVRPVEAHQRTY
jgi:glutamate-5-semialdehyde dehydrogenase